MGENRSLDGGSVRTARVLASQVFHEVAGKQSVEALKVDVETDLEVFQLVGSGIPEATAHRGFVIVPRSQVAEHFEEIGQMVFDQVGNLRNQCDNTQQGTHFGDHVLFRLKDGNEIKMDGGRGICLPSGF